ncbi:hypothetical protein B6D60_01965 [candidate division KSB1 bacterium 4484_87]|nr:MAG: hypothetical protein B6D60_01965 [candidate division KSB1 bacterium 4484_87]
MKRISRVQNKCATKVLITFSFIYKFVALKFFNAREIRFFLKMVKKQNRTTERRNPYDLMMNLQKFRYSFFPCTI